MKELEERKLAFKERVYKHDYPDLMLKAFFDHWSEHGPRDRKMSFEKQKSWDLGKRLARWKRNAINWGTYDSYLRKERESRSITQRLLNG